MDNKMTDDKIKKALECCIEGKCQLCPLYDNDTIADNCPTGVLKLCFDLINRQQAEIERLNIELKAMRGAANSYKAENERLEKQVIYLKALNKRSDKSLHVRLVKTAKAEAIKEFAERLKIKIGDLHFQNYGLVILAINDLVQEMVGE